MTPKPLQQAAAGPQGGMEVEETQKEKNEE